MRSRAVFQLVLAALFWSLGGLLIKTVDWPPLAVAGGRGLIAAAFLWLCSPGLRFRLGKRQWIAAVAYATTTLSFVVATKLTTAANAILLQYTAPFWIALLGAWVLGERSTRSDWLCIALVIPGMALFMVDERILSQQLASESFALGVLHALLLSLGSGSLTGNLVALFSGLAFAAMTMSLRAQKDASPVEPIILGNLLAFLVGLPFMLSAPLPSGLGLGALLLMGCVQLGCSYWLYARAIRHVTAMEAVLIPVIEPLLNPLWVFLVRGEKPSVCAYFGGALVLSGAVFRSVLSLRARQPG